MFVVRSFCLGPYCGGPRIDMLGFEELRDSDEIGGWQVGLEVVDFAYGAS